MLDYRERKIVGKNRPRKSSSGVLFTLVAVVALGAFSIGLGTGWFLKTREEKRAATLQAQAQKAQAAAPANPASGVNPPAKGDPALTFYETLPKGERVPLGSGLNPAKKEAPAAVPQPQPGDQRPQTPKEPQKPETARQDKAPPPAPKGAESPKAGKFAVQVASYQSKAEAEAAKAKLADKGFAARISESAIPGKGVWYRVKVGSRMEQAAAAAAAAKLGKGAIVIQDN